MQPLGHCPTKFAPAQQFHLALLLGGPCLVEGTSPRVAATSRKDAALTHKSVWVSFDNVTWLQGTSPLQQHLPTMLCKVCTKHPAPQQGQCFKQGISPSSYWSGQGTQPLRVAAAGYQGYFPSETPTPSSGASGHLNHAPLRQNPSKDTKTNLSCIPLAARR